MWMVRFGQLFSYSIVHSQWQRHNFGLKKSHKEFGCRKVLLTDALLVADVWMLAWLAVVGLLMAKLITERMPGRFLYVSTAPALIARAKTSWEWNNKAKWKSIWHLFDRYTYRFGEFDLKTAGTSIVLCIRVLWRMRRERGHFFCFCTGSMAAPPNQYAVNKSKIILFLRIRSAENVLWPPRAESCAGDADDDIDD